MRFRSDTPSAVLAHALAMSLLVSSPIVLAQGEASATLRGIVLDFKTREPLARVKVTLQGSNREVMTDEAGRFELARLQPGPTTLCVATVGYGVINQQFRLAANEVLELTIPLGAEAVKPSTVAADDELQTRANAGTEHDRHDGLTKEYS